MVSLALCFMKIGLVSNMNKPQLSSWQRLRCNRVAGDKRGCTLKVKTSDRCCRSSQGENDVFSKCLTRTTVFAAVLLWMCVIFGCLSKAERKKMLLNQKAERKILLNQNMMMMMNLIEYLSWLGGLRKILYWKCCIESICKLWIWILGFGVSLGCKVMLELHVWAVGRMMV